MENIKTIKNIINIANYKLISDYYDILIPLDLKTKKEKYLFVKDEIEKYEKVFERNLDNPYPNKDNYKYFTNKELIISYNLEITNRNKILKNIKELYIPKLLPRQIPHFNKILKCYEDYIVFLDTSKPGSGKTIVSLFVCKESNVTPFIVCPSNLVNMWELSCKMLKIDAIIISYGKLASKRGSTPKHPYLKRYENDKSSFKVTQKFKKLVSKGIILILDEISKLKSKNSIYGRACSTLSQEIAEQGTSRILALSGSPINNISNIISLYSVSGLLKSDKMYDKEDKETIKLEGLSEIIGICEKIDKKTTDYLKDKLYNNFSQKIIEKFLLTSYKYILKPVISGFMEPPKLENLTLTIRNRFYKLDKINTENIRQAYKKMDSIISKEEDEEEEQQKKLNLGKLLKYLRESERSKIPILLNQLEKISNLEKTKIVIGCNFRKGVFDSLDEIFRINSLNYKSISGDTSIKNREDYIKLFLKPNNDCKILLIMNQIIALGTNLQFNYEGWNIIYLILPSISMETTFQVTLRSHREGSKNNTEIYFVYCKGVVREKKLLNSLCKQSYITKQLLQSDLIKQSIFPDDFEDEVEEDGKFIGITIEKENKYKGELLIKVPWIIDEDNESKEYYNPFNEKFNGDVYHFFSKYFDELELLLRTAIWIMKKQTGEDIELKHSKNYLKKVTEDFDDKKLLRYWIEYRNPVILTKFEDIYNKYKNHLRVYYNRAYKKYYDKNWREDNELWF